MPSRYIAALPPHLRSDLPLRNANHHLGKRGRYWWVYCALLPAPFRSNRLRRSLSTDRIEFARARRDELFRELHAEGVLGALRFLSPRKPAVAPPVPEPPRPLDPDHHLWRNHFYWYLCCSINATSTTKEKLEFSLLTKCRETARLRRDNFLNGLHAEGLEVRLRPFSRVVLAPLRRVSPEGLARPWAQRVGHVRDAALVATISAAPAMKFPAREGEAGQSKLQLSHR